MNDLIKALQIFSKYVNNDYPIQCEHEIMIIDMDSSIVSDEDKKELKKLGFECGKTRYVYEEIFYSYRFGSC